MPFIPLEVYSNDASAVITSGGTGAAPPSGTVETWTAASAALLPAVELGAQIARFRDPDAASEIIALLGISGTTLTVLRGAENTVPVSHTAGFTVEQVVTAAGLTGLGYPPWQFPVQAYGAQGDGRIGTGGTGTSGSATFTDAGASFVDAAAPAGDVGKYIVINQGTGSASVATNPFCGTITAVNSATSVTLSANLAANCTAAPYVYGTDDAAPIAAAVAAAAQWAVSTGNYKAQVVFEPCLHMLGSVTRTTAFNWTFNAGPYTYNTHIPVPFAGQYDRKLVIDFVGTGDAAQPFFWGSVVPGLSGTCLVSAAWPTSQPDSTYGQQSVIGVPSAMTNIGDGGITGAQFANVLVNVTGISVVMPFNAQTYGFDFRYASAANIDLSAAGAFAPVNYDAQACGGPWLRATNLPANGVGCGLAMPLVGSNANDNIGYFAAEGLATGMIISEYFTAQRLSTMYCYTGIEVDTSLSRQIHGGSILFWLCEGCWRGLYCASNSIAQYPLFVGNADFEAMVWYYVDDVSNAVTGVMYWYDLSQASLDTPVSNNGAANYTVINTRLFPGSWAADAGRALPGPPAAPSTGAAQQNTSFRHATVYVSASGSITAVSVGRTSGTLVSLGLAAGAGAVIPVRVLSGHWYSVTYTGSLTVKWMLE